MIDSSRSRCYKQCDIIITQEQLQVANLTKQLKNAQEEIRDLRADNNEKKKKIHQLEMEIEALRNKVRGMNKTSWLLQEMVFTLRMSKCNAILLCDYLIIFQHYRKYCGKLKLLDLFRTTRLNETWTISKIGWPKRRATMLT